MFVERSTQCRSFSSRKQPANAGTERNPGWGGGGGEETRSGTEKRCSHNLQRGLFSYSKFRKTRTGRGNQKCLRNWNKSYHASLLFLRIVFVFWYWNAGKTRTQPCYFLTRADKCWAVKRALCSSFNVWCGVGLARALFPRFRCAWRPAKCSFLQTGNPMFFL